MSILTSHQSVETDRPAPDTGVPSAVSWHELDVTETLARQGVDPARGLSEPEAAARRAAYGPNQLVEHGLKSPLRILAEQFTNILVIVLILSAVVSAFVKGPVDAAIIFAIVVLNAALGFVQEYRAEQAMAALKKMAAPLVRVRREGRLRDIAASDLVPGDIILIEAGSAVPADARLVEVANLRVQEAALTGESQPVDKSLEPLHAGPAVPIGDRHNLIFMGTSVSYGRGVAVVVETGMNTELGRIAELIQSVDADQTPLQRRMAQLGKLLAAAALAIVALVFALGLARGQDIREMFLTAVALAVAAVPEGLPAVVTISLALGAQRMLRRRALVRKLPAVETLGSVTVICSDKTGTLTENRMTVKLLDVAGHTADIIEELRQGRATLDNADAPLRAEGSGQILLLAAGSLCSDAVLEPDENAKGDYIAVGDPTEGALVVAGARFGLWKESLSSAFPRVAEVPFSSERRRMSTVHSLDLDAALKPVEQELAGIFHRLGAAHHRLIFTKGAVDGLLEISTRVWVDGEVLPLTDDWRRRIHEASERMAANGLRVLGAGFRILESLPAAARLEQVEGDLIFVGMAGIIDPPRPEVRRAVETCLAAGIRPVMITGDHPLTAAHIARELHIAGEDARVLTGQDLSAMTQAELEAVVEEVSVYARVSPEHKLNIVQALQSRGHITAMTGDGVNDAPALRRSDIGVAMGITGTDVSKEAADMVILDDNFATIVSAVEEGRTIYDNVRKFVKYILTSNTGEISVMLLTQLLGMPLPLSTLQILWMNLVTDGVPGLALGVEPTERHAMKRKPYAPGENIFARGMGRHILTIGPLLGLVALGIGLWGYLNGNPAWRTMVFVTLTLSQLGHALAVRSDRDSLFSLGLPGNRPLLVAVAVTLALQMGVVYLPLAQGLFDTVPLTAVEMLICLALSTLVFWAVELEKLIIRRRGLPV